MVIVVGICSCATYYQKQSSFFQSVYLGEFEKANSILFNSESTVKRKDILLYYLNRGSVFWMLGKLDSSNTYFQKADFYIEDFQKDALAKTASFLVNPKIEPYGGEGFEQIMIHYYTTLNYAQQNNWDAALVECKRMMLKLQKITDYYKGTNKYKRDAFAHNLMGLIYDAQREYNPAFISYRNALQIYEEDYEKMLNTPVPLQLKKDLIRTSYLSGFYEEQRQYEEKFNLKYEPNMPQSGNLLFFWNKGLGPIKDENSITFAIVPAGNGYVEFVNTELGIVFPFYVGDTKDRNGLLDMKFVRVAFPKYVSRVPLYQSAEIHIDSLNIIEPLCEAQNIDAIAYRSLADRRAKELGEALLRLALKQLAAAAASKQNEALGFAVSLAGAITEQADTRNWQLLPYAIQYTRVTVPSGLLNMRLVLQGTNNMKDSVAFTYDIVPNQTVVGTFQSLQFTGYR